MSRNEFGRLDRRRGEGFNGCSNLLHQITCREKMFMVMASHDQGDGLKVPVARFALAGLLASQYSWEEFGAMCGAGMAHDVELEGFLKSLEFAGVAGICAVGDLSAPDPGRECLDPRLTGFELCALEAARRLAPAAKGETVCFVMDWHDPLASPALWHLEDLKNSSPPTVRERLGGLGFEHSESFLPLRAAQWLSSRFVETACSTHLLAGSGKFQTLTWGHMGQRREEPVPLA